MGGESEGDDGYDPYQSDDQSQDYDQPPADDPSQGYDPSQGDDQASAAGDPDGAELGAGDASGDPLV